MYINQCINILTGEIVSDNDDDEELELARSEDSVEEDSDKIFFLKAQRAEILKGKIFLFKYLIFLLLNRFQYFFIVRFIYLLTIILFFVLLFLHDIHLLSLLSKLKVKCTINLIVF